MDLHVLLESTLAGLGYELVDLEQSGRTKLLRLFIDKPNGINIDDCTAVSNHLTKLLAVENIEYERLEVSSPGLDRPLKKEQDFNRFIPSNKKIRQEFKINNLVPLEIGIQKSYEFFKAKNGL